MQLPISLLQSLRVLLPRQTVRPVYILMFCTLMAGAFQARAQSPAGEPATALKMADEAYVSGNWATAIEGYRTLTERDPGSVRAWYRLGTSYFRSGKLNEAIGALTRAESIGHQPMVRFDLARALARMGDLDQALRWLELAEQAGFSYMALMQKDPDLAALRKDPRYAPLEQKVQKRANPCMSLPEARQFDFWVGNWDVSRQDGSLAGSNLVQKIVGECLIFENWVDGYGATGKSISFYDRQASAWRQVWVDDKGQVLEFSGTFTEGAMRFERVNLPPSGPTGTVPNTLHRLTFFPQDTGEVRQLAEKSGDGGVTWTPEYDLQYRPGGKPADRP